MKWILILYVFGPNYATVSQVATLTHKNECVSMGEAVRKAAIKGIEVSLLSIHCPMRS